MLPVAARDWTVLDRETRCTVTVLHTIHSSIIFTISKTNIAPDTHIAAIHSCFPVTPPSSSGAVTLTEEAVELQTMICEEN